MSSDLWPWLRMTRDVSAVTGAMLGIRADLFRELGGFDEAFPVNYNDVDLCLRVRDKGLACRLPRRRKDRPPRKPDPGRGDSPRGAGRAI